MAVASSTSSPCGACKFLRRKCVSDCTFAPYFCSEQGPARFAAIHKVFGASNVSKLFANLPVHARYEAAVTLAYEAQARIRDPVYGCVAHIFALQQQVAYLQAQVMQEKAQLLASGLATNESLRTQNNVQWHILGTSDNSSEPSCSNPISRESSLEYMDRINDGNLAIMLENDMAGLQELALHMMSD